MPALLTSTSMARTQPRRTSATPPPVVGARDVEVAVGGLKPLLAQMRGVGLARVVQTSVSTTRAPSRAKSSASAAPCPRAAPVTSATRPVRRSAIGQSVPRKNGKPSAAGHGWTPPRHVRQPANTHTIRSVPMYGSALRRTPAGTDHPSAWATLPNVPRAAEQERPRISGIGRQLAKMTIASAIQPSPAGHVGKPRTDDAERQHRPTEAGESTADADVEDAPSGDRQPGRVRRPRVLADRPHVQPVARAVEQEPDADGEQESEVAIAELLGRAPCRRTGSPTAPAHPSTGVWPWPPAGRSRIAGDPG